jgi:hypothetical protein
MLDLIADVFVGLLSILGILILFIALWYLIVCILNKIIAYRNYRKAAKQAEIIALNERIKAHRLFH